MAVAAKVVQRKEPDTSTFQGIRSGHRVRVLLFSTIIIQLKWTFHFILNVTAIQYQYYCVNLKWFRLRGIYLQKELNFMTQKNYSHAGEWARKVRDPPRLWNPGQTSPEVQNRDISGPTKRTCVLQIFFKKFTRWVPIIAVTMAQKLTSSM